MDFSGSILTGIIVAYILNIVNFGATTVELRNKNDSIRKHLTSYKFSNRIAKSIGQNFEERISPEEAYERTRSRLSKMAEEFQEVTYDSPEFFKLSILTLGSYLFVIILMILKNTVLLLPLSTVTVLSGAYAITFHFYNKEGRRFWRIIDDSPYSRKKILEYSKD